METFDYVVVGAGSAGCVVAERLSANGRHSVLVLEAGGRDTSPWVRLPLGYGKSFYHPRLNWRYYSAPQPALNGRRDYWPRGRVLGGSGSINALVWARGLRQDYDDWAAAGASGWDGAAAFAAFDEIETRVSADGARAGAGPMIVQDVGAQLHPANRHFFAAVREAGLPETVDCNDPDAPEGATRYRITTRRGLRHSAARAFLHPALGRPNLVLRCGAEVARITLEGRRATGVAYRWRGQARRVAARREVVLCAGAVTSPRLLQLSGIGPGPLLQRMGLPVVLEAPQVGGNLQDHLGINYYFRATEPTLNNQLRPLWGRALVAARYALTRGGPLALSVNQCGGFFRSDPGLALPDQQLYFNPVSYTTTPSGTRNIVKPDPFAGFIIGFQPTRPTSRGRIDISSPDPAAAPDIQPNSLESAADRAAVIAGGRLCRRLMQTAALGRLTESALEPDLRQLDDDAILEDFRARCGTVFHPVGTCAMGRDPQRSVVDPQARVHGMEGLRVIDASIFPNITSGNTNAPTIMAAWRAARQMTETP